MLRRACAALLIVTAGCDAVPDLTFLPLDGGDDGGGEASAVSCDGAAGIFCCPTNICISRQLPPQCNCADCAGMGCGAGKVCCIDSQGTAICRASAAACH